MTPSVLPLSAAHHLPSMYIRFRVAVAVAILASVGGLRHLAAELAPRGASPVAQSILSGVTPGCKILASTLGSGRCELIAEYGIDQPTPAGRFSFFRKIGQSSTEQKMNVLFQGLGFFLVRRLSLLQRGIVGENFHCILLLGDLLTQTSPGMRS